MARQRSSIVTASWMSALLISLLAVHAPANGAQSTNGIVTITSDTFSFAGGQVGTSSDPTSVLTLIGEPFGGFATNGIVTLEGNPPDATTPPSTGTRIITVQGTVNEPVRSVTVNGVAAKLTGTTFQADGIPLVEGTNTITATAIDLAGNQG